MTSDEGICKIKYSNSVFKIFLTRGESRQNHAEDPASRMSVIVPDSILEHNQVFRCRSLRLQAMVQLRNRKSQGYFIYLNCLSNHFCLSANIFQQNEASCLEPLHMKTSRHECLLCWEFVILAGSRLWTKGTFRASRPRRWIFLWHNIHSCLTRSQTLRRSLRRARHVEEPLCRRGPRHIDEPVIGNDDSPE